MARFLLNSQGQRITQSIGSWIAQSLGNEITQNQSPVSTNPNLRLTTFTNAQLLNLLATRFPGLSRPITFDPAGLGIGAGGKFVNARGWYSDHQFIDSIGYWDVDGRVKQRFEVSDSAFQRGIIGSGIGTGTAGIVSQPIKADQRVYFEIHMNKYPKQVDSNGVQTTWTRNGHPRASASGNRFLYGRVNTASRDSGLGGDIELTIAPEGWVNSGAFEAGIGRQFSIAMKSLTFTETYSGVASSNADGSFASKLNVHPTNDSDLTDINDGDVFMFCIDGVQDSNVTQNNRLYFGKNGVWAEADSQLAPNTFNAHPELNFNPLKDSSGARGGWALEPTEDPYYIYITPRWELNALQPTIGGAYDSTYRYMDIDLSVKTGTDVTYAPPTSGRGHVFRRH